MNFSIQTGATTILNC